jgi:putative Mn2+ efflux pump MntP
MVGETVAEQDNQQDLMTTQSYSRLAALIFAVVAALQLIRAVSGWPITVGATTSIPLWANWVACVIAGVLAWIGFEASR